MSTQHPDTAYALTRALLDEDFGLKWTLPASDSNLRPPIPRSLNYLHWVEDLLLLAGIRLDTELRGIDIGTGASCIFPLLCCAMHPQWSFLATDTMSASVEAAVANVTANELNSRISVLHTRPSDLIGGAIAKDSAFWHSAQARNTSGRYAFVLCNPPFFAGNEHAALLKSSEESSFAGTSNELFFAPRVAPSACSHSGNNSTSVDYSRTAKECKEVEQFSSGGEVDFVRMLIDDSVASSVSSNAVVWFTSMLGRKVRVCL
jgi:23S rRNA A1618 N6-methylase RlmF